MIKIPRFWNFLPNTKSWPLVVRDHHGWSLEWVLGSKVETSFENMMVGMQCSTSVAEFATQLVACWFVVVQR